MSIFAVAAVGGTGLGPVLAGWIEMSSRLQWRWIQWIQMMFASPMCTLTFVLIKRTFQKLRCVSRPAPNRLDGNAGLDTADAASKEAAQGHWGSSVSRPGRG